LVSLKRDPVAKPTGIIGTLYGLVVHMQRFDACAPPAIALN